MKQQYCDNDLITFNLQGLLWISKENRKDYNHEEVYLLDLQYRTQNKIVRFPNEEKRDKAYETARLLLIPNKEENHEN